MAVSTALAISHEPRTRVSSIDLPGTAFSLGCYCLFLVRHGARSSDYTVDLEMDGWGSCFQKLWWSVLSWSCALFFFVSGLSHVDIVRSCLGDAITVTV